MGDWIGVIEASSILGISPNTVKKLVREGVLTAYEITGVRGYQFQREDVERLIKRVEPTPAKTANKPKKKSK